MHFGVAWNLLTLKHVLFPKGNLKSNYPRHKILRALVRLVSSFGCIWLVNNGMGWRVCCQTSYSSLGATCYILSPGNLKCVVRCIPSLPDIELIFWWWDINRASNTDFSATAIVGMPRIDWVDNFCIISTERRKGGIKISYHFHVIFFAQPNSPMTARCCYGLLRSHHFLQ